jgi:hypothetical protein
MWLQKQGEMVHKLLKNKYTEHMVALLLFIFHTNSPNKSSKFFKTYHHTLISLIGSSVSPLEVCMVTLLLLLVIGI